MMKYKVIETISYVNTVEVEAEDTDDVIDDDYFM